MDARFLYSRIEVVDAELMQFGVLSPHEIRQMSVAEIKYGETMEMGKPKCGGLSDLRLGPADPKLKCESCDGDRATCPGHFGHLELAKPMFHVGFMKTVLTIMQCVCFKCSKVLADREDPKMKQALLITHPKTRLRKVLEACKGKEICEAGEGGGCGATQPTISVDGMNMVAKYRMRAGRGDDQDDQQLSAQGVLDVLKRISDDDCRLLGLNPRYARPDWMILEVLPIPPPCTRPAVMVNTPLRSEDDLTHQLATIIRHNENLERQERRGAPGHIIKEFSLLLQFHITAYLNNELPGQPRATQRSGRPIKSLCSRLKGKEGRVRGNLMGKRGNFSSRTVITPDPSIDIDELGVPLSIAQNLTIPETVTPYNIERMEELVKYGCHPPPGKTGAKYIIRDDGRRIDLRYMKNDDPILEIGDKVERHLMDGDIVVLNRQPSLHKMSIMGHRVKIMPYSTFRLNLSVTSPYNADFDGDEMNMHVPQSYESRAEVLELMMVPKCIVSPQSNKPVMGIVQDTLIGCWKITKRDTFIEKDVFMNMLMWLEDFEGDVPQPAILKPRPLWSGKQVFNLIIPKQINLVRYSAWHQDTENELLTPGDTQVLVENGELITGTLCKKTLGTSGGSLIHVIWEEVGPDAARKFLGHTQGLVNYWLLQNGFSIGIGDTIVDAATMDIIKETISKAKLQVKDLVRAAQEKQLEAEPGRTMMESFENGVNQVLNKARDDAGSSAQRSLSESNNLKAMVSAGSKGSFINISQMTACVGQQNVEGKRIPFGFNGRTLPHYTKDDYGPESRGFVENSYLRGLTPQEFFFHAMGGREGLIDTAVKTSSTGYIQRRLVKTMEDIMVKYDGTVRNSQGDVIQFLYGEDGMDAVWLESQKLESLKMKKPEFDEVFRHDFGEELEVGSEHRCILDNEVQKLEEDRFQMGTEGSTTCESSFPLPVNLMRLISNAQNLFKIDRRVCSDLRPRDIVEAVDELQKRLKVVHGDDILSMEAQKNATSLFGVLLRSTLASKRVLREFRLTRAAFEWVVGEIESRFLQSLVAPGEMVGCVAAQSIGEPATQMTLNTFHYAGVSAKNVTLGVPRLTEIINVVKNIKTPSLSVYLKSREKGNAKRVQSELEYTTLRDVTRATEVWYDPDPMTTMIEEDLEFVEAYYEMPDEEVPVERISPWLLRIELNKEMMADKKVSVVDIADKVNAEFAGDLLCIFSDDNAEKLILRIRLIVEGMLDQDQNGDDAFLKKLAENMLTEMSLKGIPGIKKVFIRSGKVNRFDEHNGFRPESEWVLDTDGGNLLAVMSHEEVDAARTTSNHAPEVLEVLGIEAARKALLDELRAVISFDGSYVNYRHLAVLCDAMTYRGHLTAVTRHGINRSGAGPLMRCSFEETVKNLLDAAVYAESDPLKGVSGNIILGRLAPIGSGGCTLYLNEDALPRAADAQPSSSPIQDITASPADDSVQTCIPTYSPNYVGMYTPAVNLYDSPGSPPYTPMFSPNNVGNFSPPSPAYSSGGSPSHTPVFSPSIGGHSPSPPTHSPVASPDFSPSSPYHWPSHWFFYCPSPSYSPSSPIHNTSSRYYSPTSPYYSPNSPSYYPSSPTYGASSPSSPHYSPPPLLYSPIWHSVYSPSSHYYYYSSTARYLHDSYDSSGSPPYTSSPIFSPDNGNFSPPSPTYSSGGSPSHTPVFSPSIGGHSPSPPTHSPAASPDFSPSSPYHWPSHWASYCPSPPSYSPSSPIHNTSSRYYSPTSPYYSPNSPSYYPSSPTYGASSPPSPHYSPPPLLYSPIWHSVYSPSSHYYYYRSPATTPSRDDNNSDD